MTAVAFRLRGCLNERVFHGNNDYTAAKHKHWRGFSAISGWKRPPNGDPRDVMLGNVAGPLRKECRRLSLTSARRPRIADRHHLPLVTVGLVPVNAHAAELRVDRVVQRPAHRAAIRDPGRLDAQ